MAKRWTQKDIAYLNAKAGKEVPATIATALDKTERAVTNYARKHGISLAVTRKRWTKEEDETVRDAVLHGQTIRQIATQLGRSEKAVYHRVDALRGVSDVE